MSLPLFKLTFKKNWPLLLIFCLVLLMYSAVMISMYNPESLAGFNDMLKLLPENLVRAIGFGNVSAELTGYVASTLYAFIMFMFPLIYCIILGNRLVAKTVDDGSMAYLLSTPNSRSKIIITQGVYALFSIVLMFAFVFCAGTIACSAMFPNSLSIAKYLAVNAITMLVTMTVIMICFFFSCVFNDTKFSLGLGCAVPVGFIILNMMSNSTTGLEWMRKLSIYGWYTPATVAAEGMPIAPSIAYIAIIAILFIASVLIFKKKKLPL